MFDRNKIDAVVAPLKHVQEESDRGPDKVGMVRRLNGTWSVLVGTMSTLAMRISMPGGCKSGFLYTRINGLLRPLLNVCCLQLERLGHFKCNCLGSANGASSVPGSTDLARRQTSEASAP